MVKYCLVRGCSNVWYPGCTRKFHRFPKNIQRRNLWLSILQTKHKFYRQGRVCDLHFSINDYDHKSGRLSHNAIPVHFYIDKKSDCEQSPPTVPKKCTGSSTTETDREKAEVEKVPGTSLNAANPLLYQLLVRRKSEAEETISDECSKEQVVDDSIGLYETSFEEIVDETSSDTISCEKAINGNISNRHLRSNMSVQAKLKTRREIILQKSIKVLNQKSKRHEKTLNDMKSILRTVKKHASKTDIKNIFRRCPSDLKILCKKFLT